MGLVLGQCRRPFVLSNAFARLSTTRFVQQIIAIKYPNCLKTGKMWKKFDPNFFRRATPTFLWYIVSAIYRPPFGSLVEFHLLICVCKAWRWNRMRNLRIVGKNGGPVWSRLWTKVHVVLRRCRRPLAVVNALARLSISCFIPNI